MACSQEPVLVDDVHRWIAEHLRAESKLLNFEVVGEIRSLFRTQAGHVFFDFCGDSSSLRCAAWANSMRVDIREGRCILRVRGIEWEQARGRCLAIVSDWRASLTIGCCAAARVNFLREKLRTEGLLPRRPAEIPEIATHLCIITSQGSAAEQDILEGCNAKWPNLRTTLVHTPVQGRGACAGIIAALEIARTKLSPPADVIICSRGGGSESDLAVFNEEPVVRACIWQGAPFLICAIGHESDHLLAEEAAHLRAKTPTAAVEKALPQSKAALQEQLNTQKNKLCIACRSFHCNAIKRHAQIREALAASVKLTNVQGLAAVREQRFDLGRAREKILAGIQRCQRYACTDLRNSAAQCLVSAVKALSSRWRRLIDILRNSSRELRASSAEVDANLRAKISNSTNDYNHVKHELRAAFRACNSAARTGAARKRDLLTNAYIQGLKARSSEKRVVSGELALAWRRAICKLKGDVQGRRAVFEVNHPRRGLKRGSAWLCNPSGTATVYADTVAIGTSVLLLTTDHEVEVVVQSIRERTVRKHLPKE